ncbi:MAG: MerR family transcriptional regulator [Alphaproteobacteria bacterium]|tara:strand:+ start:801 stop:1112 length:312 start_codon:yes stop_codon:yes gene_type:complete
MKSNSTFKKIGLISKELNIPIHVIRFWEQKFSILKPTKKPNGTRYYSVDQQKILEEIKDLLYEKKYSIDGANQVLKKRIKNTGEKEILITEIENLIKEIKFKC